MVCYVHWTYHGNDPYGDMGDGSATELYPLWSDIQTPPMVQARVSGEWFRGLGGPS